MTTITSALSHATVLECLGALYHGQNHLTLHLYTRINQSRVTALSVRPLVMRYAGLQRRPDQERPLSSPFFIPDILWRFIVDAVHGAAPFISRYVP